MTAQGAVGGLVRRVLGGRLARVSLGSFVLKAVGMVLLFGLSVVLARVLGPVAYGTYEFVIAWVTLLLVPATLGLDRLAVRVTSAAMERREPGVARGILRWSTMVVAGWSVVVAGATAAVVAAGGGTAAASVAALLIGCLILPVNALTVVWEGALRGLQHVIAGQVPILIVRPLGAVLLFLLGWRVLGLPPNAYTALGSYLLAGLGALLTCGILLATRRPDGMRRAAPETHPRAWLAAAVPITIMTALYIGNGRVGTILLGSLTGPEAAGIYALALRGADLVMFALVAVNTALSPTFAALHAKGDRAALQATVTKGARLIAGLALPVAAFMLLFGHVFLGIFGHEYVAGTGALRILTVGQIFNVAMGPVGVLLVMAGRERLATLGFGAGLAVNLALATVLIPAYGIEGAAWAATASMLIWNVALGVLTYRSLGVEASLVGRLGGRGDPSAGGGTR